MVSDGVALVENVGASRTELVDKGIGVGNGTNLVLNCFVRVHRHLWHAMKTHHTILIDYALHFWASEIGEPVGEVKVDVLQLVR